MASLTSWSPHVLSLLRVASGAAFLAHGTMKQWPEEDALVDHVDDVRVKMRDLRLVDRLRRIRGRF